MAAPETAGSGAVLRPERPGDEEAIARIVEKAFATAPHASGTEALIVRTLRRDGDLALSLVGELGGGVIGHLALSPVLIGGADGFFGLGPVAVLPDRQKAGIGGALIRHALAWAEGSGARGVVLLGDPGDYARFGFEGGIGLSHGDVPPPYVQGIGFGTGPLPRGPLAYAPAFDLAGAGGVAES